MPVNNQYNVLPPDLSSLPDEDSIRETALKEKESFEAGEADGRKEDCSEVHQSAIITESTLIVFALLSLFYRVDLPYYIFVAVVFLACWFCCDNAIILSAVFASRCWVVHRINTN